MEGFILTANNNNDDDDDDDDDNKMADKLTGGGGALSFLLKTSLCWDVLCAGRKESIYLAGAL